MPKPPPARREKTNRGERREVVGERALLIGSSVAATVEVFEIGSLQRVWVPCSVMAP